MRFLAALFFSLSIMQSGILGGFTGLVVVFALVALYEDYLSVRNKRR